MQTKTFSYTFSDESVVKITVTYKTDEWMGISVDIIETINYQNEFVLSYRMLEGIIERNVANPKFGDWTNITKL
jgi:hypothetical protein